MNSTRRCFKIISMISKGLALNTGESRLESMHIPLQIPSALVSQDIRSYFHAFVFTGYMMSNLECCARQGINRANSNCLPITLPKDDPYFKTFKRTCMNFVRSLPSAALDCNVGKYTSGLQQFCEFSFSFCPYN